MLLHKTCSVSYPRSFEQSIKHVLSGRTPPVTLRVGAFVPLPGRKAQTTARLRDDRDTRLPRRTAANGKLGQGKDTPWREPSAVQPLIGPREEHTEHTQGYSQNPSVWALRECRRATGPRKGHVLYSRSDLRARAVSWAAG